MKDLGTRPIETPRLLLRRFVMEDAEAMFTCWSSDPAVARFVNWNVHTDISQTRERIAIWLERYEQGYMNWAVECKETGELVGSIHAMNVNEVHSNCEVGYCYGRAHWGKGYATEALSAVLDYLLTDCEMHVVTACYRSLNPASGRVMEKAGMHQEAVLKERRFDAVTGTWCDLICCCKMK